MQSLINYLTSVFLGHARADDLLTKFLDGVKGLPIDKLVQISMDGPSVNWSFVAKFKEHMNEENGETKLLHVGLCYQWRISDWT